MRNSGLAFGQAATLAATPPEFIGQNVQIQKLLALAREGAVTDAPILITGESGTGKEILARNIHWQSRRRERPYVAVNCGAITGSLEESELFGYVPGAFTGAQQRKTGRFEAAHTGTIFLDEIGETSLQLQVKMLRVLQDGEYAPVGSAHNHHCDVRVIAATNQNLGIAVADGTFRGDLFYRLDVLRLRVPPLRERRDDIPLLVKHFVGQYSQRYGFDVPPVENSFHERLLRLEFPGNVRELSNYVHRAVIASNGASLTAAILDGCIHEPQQQIAPDQPDVRAFVSQVLDSRVSTDLRPQDRARQEDLQSDDPVGGMAAQGESGAKVVRISKPEDSPSSGEGSSFHEAKKRLIEIFEREFLISVLTECGGIIHRAAERAGISERSFHTKLRQYGIDGNSYRAGGCSER